MRFDDSLQTVLAADTSSAFGAQSAFRQLVDLIGRRRIPAEGEALARLRALARQVPTAVRAASARALALADPPAALVEVFAADEPAVAAPVLRVARLSDEEWLALLPRLGPAGRALLRGRAGLSGAVRRGLAAFGPTDFTIEHADRQSERHEAGDPPAPPPTARQPAQPEPAEPSGTAQTFAIADLVQRIESFQQVRERRPAPNAGPVDRFAFQTDVGGVIDWTDAAARPQLIGRALVRSAGRGSDRARIDVSGSGELAGGWQVAAVPAYSPRTGRLLGYDGVARRAAEPREQPIQPDALRRLVHELRTPTNAIAGFAELIGTELLGPAEPAYRARAGTIGTEVHRLIGAIDDLDVSARVDGGALDLAPRPVALRAALEKALADAGPGDRLTAGEEADATVIADPRVLGRLLSQLAALVAGSLADGTRATVELRASGSEVALVWPWSVGAADDSLLGADFTLRLAHKLARALGGRLVPEAGRLTLYLKEAFNAASDGDDPLT